LAAGKTTLDEDQIIFEKAFHREGRQGREGKQSTSDVIKVSRNDSHRIGDFRFFVKTLTIFANFAPLR
jgi:hypothetical protein